MNQFKKNINQKKSQIANNILNHLNQTCSQGNVFEMKTIEHPENQISYIKLKQYNEDNNIKEKQILQEILVQLFKYFPILCSKQIQQLKDVIIPNCFKLQISFDQVTKQQLQMPFKVLNSDKLILCPLFCDFQIYLEKITESQNQFDDIKNIDADEYYIILLMWNIRSLLNKLNKNQAQFELILYPKQHNFGIYKIENNKEIMYFSSLTHQQQFLKQNSKFHKQSKTISEALKQKILHEFEVSIFEFQQINDGIKQLNDIIPMNPKSCKSTLSLKQNQKNFSTNQLNYIIPKNPIRCQSTLCLNDDLQHNLKHFIKFEQNVNPQCQCGKEFDPYSFDTIFIDYKLSEAFDKIILDLNLGLERFDQNIFLNPLFIEIEQDQYNNYFIQLFLKNNNNQKEQLIKHFFEGKMQNYNLHLIEDRQGNLDKLLQGAEEIDYSENYLIQLDENSSQEKLNSKETKMNSRL